MTIFNLTKLESRKKMKKNKVAGFMLLTMVAGVFLMNPMALATQEESIEPAVTASSSSEKAVNSNMLEEVENTNVTNSENATIPIVEASEPDLLGVVNKTVRLGEEFDPKASVTATDTQDGDLTAKIEINGSVDTTKIGEYPLVYSVKNSTGNMAIRHATISVQATEIEKDENIGPEQERYRVEIPELTLPRYADYKQAIRDKMVIKNSKGEVISPDKVSISITSTHGTSKLGNSTAMVEISQENALGCHVIAKMTVISGIVIEQPDIDHRFFVGDKKEQLDPYMFFDAYEVGMDGNEIELGKFDANKKVGIEILDNPVDFSKAGTYTIKYKITNSLGEELHHSYDVIVREKRSMKLSVMDKVMYVGDKLTEDMVLNWADIENVDQIAFEVIDDEIEVDSITNQLLAVGTYKIRFTAIGTDEGTGAETSTQAEMMLTVKEREGKGLKITGEPTTINNNTNARKVLPRKVPPKSSTGKNLPRTGSEKLNVFPIFVGVIISGVALLIWGKNYRTVKG